MAPPTPVASSFECGGVVYKVLSSVVLRVCNPLSRTPLLSPHLLNCTLSTPSHPICCHPNPQPPLCLSSARARIIFSARQQSQPLARPSTSTHVPSLPFSSPVAPASSMGARRHWNCNLCGASRLLETATRRRGLVGRAVRRAGLDAIGEVRRAGHKEGSIGHHGA